MSGLSSPLLAAVFLLAAAAIWAAGTRLADATDALDSRLGLGAALGGLILLALATNLPEIAITVTGAAKGDLALAIGNLVGGIAIQTVVLVVLDAAGRRDRPLSYLAGSLSLVLEGLLVMTVLVLAIMASRLPVSASLAGVSPGSVVVVAAWVGGLLAVRRAGHGLRWKAEAPDSAPGRDRGAKAAAAAQPAMPQRSTPRVAAVFALAALVTLAGGIAVEEAGAQLAGRIGLSGAVFGATILAATTALPEVSTGLRSVRIGDNALAFSDIFGGNAFLVVLFLVADLVAGRPTLPRMHDSDLWMAGLGVALTAVYVAGIVLRPTRVVARMGLDSVLVLVLYALGILGLAAVGG